MKFDLIKNLFKKKHFVHNILLFFYKRIPFFVRAQKIVTIFLGHKNKRTRELIEIDITYKCDLLCLNCNRSCRQAPSNDSMTIEQIRKFVQESKEKNIKWKQISFFGGEPTLHPNLFDFIDILLEYKRNFSNTTIIQVASNGYSSHANEILNKIPPDVDIRKSRKKSPFTSFYPINLAPIDSKLYKFTDYSNACWTTSYCSIGLTPYGYYPCPVAGSIDRVFGFDYGRKQLPDLKDDMIDQLNLFCRLCGHFRSAKSYYVRKEIYSPSWEYAYKNYKEKAPKLTLY